MTWTVENDTLHCREILVEEPLKFKIGTRERGHSWEKEVTNLKKICQAPFIGRPNSSSGPF